MDETQTTGLGGGGVHSQIGVQPSKGEGMSGKYDAASPATGTVEGAKERAGEMADQARDQVHHAADEARDRLADAKGRAEELVGQARSRAGDLLEQAEDSAPVRMARDNPLPALGIAFAAGFLLAGSSDTGGRFGRAKQQIRGAVMGGVSAALAQEVRGMLGMQDGEGGGLLDSLMGDSRSGGGGRASSRAGRGRESFRGRA